MTGGCRPGQRWRMTQRATSPTKRLWRRAQQATSQPGPSSSAEPVAAPARLTDTELLAQWFEHVRSCEARGEAAAAGDVTSRDVRVPEAPNAAATAQLLSAWAAAAAAAAEQSALHAPAVQPPLPQPSARRWRDRPSTSRAPSQPSPAQPASGATTWRESSTSKSPSRFKSWRWPFGGRDGSGANGGGSSNTPPGGGGSSSGSLMSSRTGLLSSRGGLMSSRSSVHTASAPHGELGEVPQLQMARGPAAGGLMSSRTAIRPVPPLDVARATPRDAPDESFDSAAAVVPSVPPQPLPPPATAPVPTSSRLLPVALPEVGIRRTWSRETDDTSCDSPRFDDDAPHAPAADASPRLPDAAGFVTAPLPPLPPLPLAPHPPLSQLASIGRWRHSELGVSQGDDTPTDDGHVAIRPDATPIRAASRLGGGLECRPNLECRTSFGSQVGATSAAGTRDHADNDPLGGLSAEALGVWWSESDEESKSSHDDDEDEAADQPSSLPLPMPSSSLPTPAAAAGGGGKSMCGPLGKGGLSPASTSRGVTGGEGGTTSALGAPAPEADYNGFKAWPSTPQQWANSSAPPAADMLYAQRLRDMGGGADDTMADKAANDDDDEGAGGGGGGGGGGAGWIDFAELQRQMKFEAAQQGVDGGRRGTLDLEADALPSPHTLLSLTSQQRDALADRAEKRRVKEERRAERDVRREEKEARREAREQRRAWKVANAAIGLGGDARGERDAARTLLRHSGAAFAAGDFITAEQHARQAHALHPEPLCLLSLANIFVAGPDRIGARGMRLPDRHAATTMYQQVATDPNASPHLQAIASERLAILGVGPGGNIPPSSMPPPGMLGMPGMPPDSQMPPGMPPLGMMHPPPMPPQSYRDPYSMGPPHFPPPMPPQYGGGYGPSPPNHYQMQGWGPPPYGMAPQAGYGPPPPMTMHGYAPPPQMPPGAYGAMPYPPPPRLGAWDA